MSDPEPIDLSQLQNLNLAPDWVGDLQRRDTAPGEVVWGRAPDPGGGGGQRGGGNGPRRDGGGFGGRGGFQDRSGPGGPRGPRNDGPRGPGGGGGGAGFSGPRPAGGGGFGGPRPAGGGGGGFNGPRNEGPRGPRNDRPLGDGPRGPRPEGRSGPRPAGDRRDGGGGGDRRDGGGRGDFRGRGPQGGHGRFDDRPHIAPLPGWGVRLFAEPRSLEAIVRQIKASGRAYPVFELGRLFLAGRDRYVLSFSRLSAPSPKRSVKGEPVAEAPAMEGPAELFQVTADGSLWLSRDEAIRHILQGAGIQNFYRRETITIDPPKGTFTAVAVCGFSGEILGPPNHHSFQTTVARLHREKFYNLPLDRYKSRIRSEKDETLVAKWLEEQSTTVVYVPVTAAELRAAAEAKVAAEAKGHAVDDPSAPGETPAVEVEENSPAVDSPDAPIPQDQAGLAVENESEADSVKVTPALGAPEENTAAAAAAASEEIPEEFVKEPGNEAAATPEAAAEVTVPLRSQAEMEAHFLQHHAPHAVRAVTRAKVPGNIPGKLLAPPLLALLRMEVEQQQRFPMQLVQDLCRDLEKQSLKFFKRDRKATFVCRTRPHYIADEAHLSPRLRSIVGVVRANPGITHPRLVSTMAPHVEKMASPAGETPAKGADVTGAPPIPATATAEEVPSSPAAPSANDPAETPAVETPAAELADATDTAFTIWTGLALNVARAAAEPASAPMEATPQPAAGPLPVAAEPPTHHLTSEEIAVLQDLRWLVQEGYVTEFASGELQLLGRPPQPLPEKKEKSAPEKLDSSPSDQPSRGKGKNKARFGPRLGDAAFTIWTRRAFNVARRAAEQAATAAAAAETASAGSAGSAPLEAAAPVTPMEAAPDASSPPEPSSAPSPESPPAGS